MSSTETLYAEAALGRDAEEFWATDVGRYVLARIEEEETEALDKLYRVSPFRWRRILELKADIRRVRDMKAWFSELIVTGRQAMQQLPLPQQAPGYAALRSLLKSPHADPTLSYH